MHRIDRAWLGRAAHEREVYGAEMRRLRPENVTIAEMEERAIEELQVRASMLKAFEQRKHQVAVRQEREKEARRWLDEPLTTPQARPS